MPPQARDRSVNFIGDDDAELPARQENEPESDAVEISWRPVYKFGALLCLDGFLSTLCFLPLFRPLEHWEDVVDQRFSWHGSLWDVAVLSWLRIACAVLAMACAYYYPRQPPPTDDDPHKTKEDLEQEALEESYLAKAKRHVQRYSLGCEMAVLTTGIWISIKSMARLNVEIGLYQESQPEHPMFWLALAMAGVFSLGECLYMDSIEGFISKVRLDRNPRSTLEESPLTEPLLLPDDDNSQNKPTKSSSTSGLDDCDYQSSWADIVEFVLPDRLWIFLATLFLLGAAFCNVLVPHYTGKILDALVGDHNNSTSILFYEDDHNDILHIPGFVANIQKLVLVSVLGGLFAGVRGAVFSTVGARCNARLRRQLMDSLLVQDIGFYDTTRTGDITSRLSSDTTLVGSAVTNNVNVFLRSLVRAAGVLIFMCYISWQLSLLAFLTVPAVSVLSKWYGRYVRKLSKAQQKKLAQGNNVSEVVVSSMATVRAFGAERLELEEFDECMEDFLRFNLRSAVATFGYQAVVGALPQLVKALVLFYGGLLVQSEHNPMTGGQLITFVLYLSTLAESFNSLGGIYASLSRAVGASEKVFALMHRKPKRSIPPKAAPRGDSTVDSADQAQTNDLDNVEEQPLTSASTASDPKPKKSLLRMLLSREEKRPSQVEETYTRGLNPAVAGHGGGEITFNNVQARYPARPDRTVLDGLDLTIPAGSICALVGSSGSGKSSIVKLIQNLYKPSGGKVCIDGVDVRDLSQEWLTKNVAVVSQEPTLFARSCRDNITYGLETLNGSSISDERVVEAARMANADEFIARLPQGYNTEVGERGIQLSGGQRQRMAIARAIVRRPRVLLLDEATAALDSESEFLVQRAIDDMISDQRASAENATSPMTVLMIAHRLSTVRNADIIFVIEDGQVVEKGNHDQLVAVENGVYKALVGRQMNHN